MANSKASTIQAYQINGLNLKVSPFSQNAGDLIRSVNVETDMIGMKRKRPGYNTYLGTSPNGSNIDHLFNWTQNDGTTFWNYAVAGGVVYYSTQGTGAWTVCGNGTLTAGAEPGHAVNANTLIIGDGTAATRHTTNGTSFTNTTAAPIARYFADYQERIYAGGTASTLFWSNVGTPSDWTNDSSSIEIPGPGRLNAVRKVADRIVTSKNSGIMHRYDGFNLVDLATTMGPTSDHAIDEIEGFNVYPNRRGFYGYGGGRPEILSNAIEKQIYNDAGNGIAGTTFDTMPAAIHKYRYYASVGTVTDDLTNEAVNDCVEVYDFQLDQWWNYQYNNFPASFLSFKDNNQVEQFIFASGNQCYQVLGTATSDNGATIASLMEGFIHGGTLREKKWEWILAMFNPGANAKVQVAIVDTFTRRVQNWIDLRQQKDGVYYMKFPAGTRGRFLLWKIYEASRNTRWSFYEFEFSAKVIKR